MDSTDYFRDVASQWDNMRQNFFPEALREKAYSVAQVKKGELAADIGSGTGFLTEGLLQKGLSVIAVDRSEEMLAQMKEKFKDFHGVSYRQGEAEHLPIENDFVDYALANMYLHHVETPLRAIREMVRIVKAGGKVVITDLDEHNHEFLRTEHHDQWMGFKREDIHQWLADAGLVNIRIDCVGENCCSTSSCSQDEAAISIFIAYGEKA